MSNSTLPTFSLKSSFGFVAGGATTIEEELRTDELEDLLELDLNEDELDEDELTVELDDMEPLEPVLLSVLPPG